LFLGRYFVDKKKVPASKRRGGGAKDLD